jgi:dTDP-4-dehydrorhamnose reductase
MNTILVTGGNGQLGKSIANIANDYLKLQLIIATKAQLNISNYKAVEAFVEEHEINVIVNTAAYTNVDNAEDEPSLANEINFLAVENLAKIAKEHHIKLIHISTDYVFDGRSEIPYTEHAIPNPQNVYGSSKLKGENALLAINPSNSIIIRTSWLYSEFGANFVKTMLRLTFEKQEVSVVSDQLGAPTYAADLANAILQIVPKLHYKKVQIFHYANQGQCSWFQFAKEIVQIAKHSCKVFPVSSSQFHSKAIRPAFSLLETKKIQETFNLEIPSWKNSLNSCIKKIK